MSATTGGGRGVRSLRRGQITLPREFRQQLGISDDRLPETGGPLRAEQRVPADAVRVKVPTESRTRGSSDSWRLEAACAP